MGNLSNITTDISESVKDTVKEEAKAIGRAAKSQLFGRRPKEQAEDQDLAELKRKEKVQRRRLLNQKLAELRSLRQTNQLPAPTEKPQSPGVKVPQLKRIEGWRTEVARHYQEVGAGKGKG